jgi:hypothetical protein
VASNHCVRSQSHCLSPSTGTCNSIRGSCVLPHPRVSVALNLGICSWFFCIGFLLSIPQSATPSNHGDHDQCPSFSSSLVHTSEIAHPATFCITGKSNIHALLHSCFHQSLRYAHSKLSINLIYHTAAILFCYVELYAQCSNESLPTMVMTVSTVIPRLTSDPGNEFFGQRRFFSLFFGLG